MSKFHEPVLLEEVIQGFGGRKALYGHLFIDATIGGGGHTETILTLGGRVLGVDKDIDAIKHLKKKFESEIRQGSLILVRGNYSEIKQIAQHCGIKDVDGILFDLGVSSNQIDRSGRGFSFLRDEPLDMRMGIGSLTAMEIVNSWSVDELYEIFAKYGEEIRARKIAEKIALTRRGTEITTTGQLATLIGNDMGTRARIFQALRIVVNDEIGSLRQGLTDGFKLLGESGIMEVISFHSLEDRVVKLFFQQKELAKEGKVVNKKPIVASGEESKRNRRSRSAKLRIVEKVNELNG